MNINLVLELKYHIEKNNTPEASRVAIMLAEEWMSKEHPNLKERDPILYAEVMHISVPKMMNFVREMVDKERQLAS